MPASLPEQERFGRPEQLAARLVGQHDDAWLDRFTEAVAAQRAAADLRRFLDAWGLSLTEAARLFGISRQALTKWRDGQIPADRVAAVADLGAATDLLVHHLRRDRIPAVVRRPAAGLGGSTLLELAGTDTGAVVAACEEMFDFSRIHA